MMTLPATAASFTWTGASGSDLDWLTAGNWSPSGPPGTGDDAQFFDDGAASDAVTIDNIVSQNTTVQSLWYGQTNGWHNTLIDSGMTLTLAGTGGGNVLLEGTETQPSITQTVSNTISGTGGTLVIDNTNADILIRQAYAGGSGAHWANLDMSSLDNFTANLGRVEVGVGDSSTKRSTGFLTLAKVNNVTLFGSAPQLLVSDNSSNNNGNSQLSTLTLGMQNNIYADTIRIGGQKCAGSMVFGSSNSSLYLRGSDGTNRVSEFDIGDDSHQGGSGNPSKGIVDLSNGTADILADVMYLGRGQSGSGKGGSDGTLTLGAGTLDVNTLEVGYQNASSAVGAVSGTVTVGSNGLYSAGAMVTVHSNLDLGVSAGSAAGITSTLDINGGELDDLGAFSCAGTVNVSVTGGGRLNLPPGSALLGNAVTVDGGTISNLDVLQATTSLNIYNGGIIGSPKTLDMGTTGTANWDVSGTPAGGLVVSNQFSGAGNFNGNLTMAPGSTFIPGGLGSINGLYLNNSLNLDGATMRVDLSNNGFGGNDALYAYGNLTLGATNSVRITALNGALDTVNPYTLINYYGTLTGDQTDFQIVGAIAESRYTFTFSTNTATQIQLLVGGTGAANLLWQGDGLTNTWDLKTTANWNNGGTSDKFYNLDSATFDDTGSASPVVNVVGSLVPGSITMSNDTKAYVFAGSGSFASGSLTNYGTGGLTIGNDGTNDFSVIDVENGNLTLGGNSANTCDNGLLVNNYSGVGTVSVTIANANANDFGPAGIVLNNGVLIFDQPADATLSSPITGYGTITKINTNTLTLSGNNSGWSYPITVNAGVLRAGSSTALGTGGIIVTNGGALDVAGQSLGVTVTASGAGPNGEGAIINSGPDTIYSFGTLVLAGDTTFGGTARWDIRSGADSLSCNNMGYNITKVGTNEVALVNSTVDPTLGNIDVQQGEFAIQEATISNGGIGDPSKTITVHSGANLETYSTGDTSPIYKVVDLQDGAILQNDHGDSVYAGPFAVDGNVLINQNNHLILSNTVSGTGGLTLEGGSTLIIQGTATYSGATRVTNGTLQVDGAIGGSGVDVAGGTLSGAGSVTAPVTIETNGVLSPGDGGIGTLSLANTLTLAGVNRMDVDDTGGMVTSDLITNVTTLTLGGTLQLNITGDTALTNGDSIQLYSANTITGSFASIVPATPGTGLQWDTSELSSGILKVAVATTQLTMSGIIVADGNAVISGSGGNPGANYYVLTTTNVSLPLSSWTPVATNQFDGAGDFNFTNTVSADPQQFYIIQLQ
jgi:fibronectin-binding autotransporter adhesin